MSEITKTVTIACPRCGEVGEAPIWDEIDAKTTRRDARHVLDESLFEVKCNQCRKKSSLNYPLVYHDGDNRFLVRYIAGDDECAIREASDVIEQEARRMIGKLAQAEALEGGASNREAESAARAAAEAPDALDGYTLRITATRNALREKVVILRNGLDDRAIEVIKLTTFNIASSQGKLKGAKEPYFGGVKKTGDVLIDFVGGRSHRETKVGVDLYDKVLADVQAYEDDVNAHLVVDRKWAEAFLAHQEGSAR